MADNTASRAEIELFEALDAYPWDQDQDFQSGLVAILGDNPSPSQAFDLTIRAKCFYYAREKNVEVSADAYKAYLDSRSRNNPGAAGAAADQNPPYPTSFANIVALITSGAPIPGIRDIPDTVLTDQATQPKVPMRRKPWEKEGTVPQIGRTFGDRRDEYIAQDTPNTQSDFGAQF